MPEGWLHFDPKLRNKIPKQTMYTDSESDFANGHPVGSITTETKGTRDYVIYRYRWWYKKSPVVNYSKSFRIEDYNNDEAAARRAAVAEQDRYCAEFNIRRNDYRLLDDGSVVEMKLCLFTANVPSEDYIQFDASDLELVRQQMWYHDENRGAVYIDRQHKSNRVPLSAYLYYNGVIDKQGLYRMLHLDGNWRNNRRSNIAILPRKKEISTSMVSKYNELRVGYRNDDVGYHDKKSKRVRLVWSEQGAKRQKCFSYAKSDYEAAQKEAKKFILSHVPKMLGEWEESDDSDEPDLGRFADGKRFNGELAFQEALQNMSKHSRSQDE